ncbi:hypothetical protein C8J57DRAFT_1460187 [Mycena rebaudengoi]|nr:hypothetical protein C8J57DRAFT_1460187 [Mycena rebaudengoi]
MPHSPIKRPNIPKIPCSTTIVESYTFPEEPEILEHCSPYPQIPVPEELMISLFGPSQRTNRPSDWWHRDTGLVRVCPSGELCYVPHIPFFPNHGPCTAGVAAYQAARSGTGVRFCHDPISRFLSAEVLAYPFPYLSIRWPGYQAVDETGVYPFNFDRPITLHDPRTGGAMSLGAFAAQIAVIFREFVQNYGVHCNLQDPHGILLGPDTTGGVGVHFQRLRMVKLWTKDYGAHWQLEVAIVAPFYECKSR